MPKRNNIEFQPALNQNNPPNKVSSAVMGILAIAAGTYPLLIGLGTIPAAGGVHAPLFVLTAVGTAFIAAGLGAILPGFGVSPNGFIMKIVGLFVVIAMMTPFGWMAFGNNGIDIVVKTIIGVLFGFFALIFAFATVASFAPGLAARFGIKVIDNNDPKMKKFQNKQRKL